MDALPPVVGGGSTAPPPLDRAKFSAQFASPQLVSRALQPLYEALKAIDNDASLTARHEQVVRIARWLRTGAGKKPKSSKKLGPGEPVVWTRVRALARILEEVPTFRAPLAQLLGSVLRETDGVRLFSELGLPNDRGILEETTDRLSRRLLPRPYDEKDLRELLAGVLPKKVDALWMRELSPELAAALAHQIGVDAFEPVRRAMVDAAALVALRVSALGLSDDVRTRSPECSVIDSPFWRLRREVDTLVERWRAEDVGDPAPHFAAVLGHAAACRDALSAVHERLETHGVSVDVVYRLECIEKSLQRLEVLLRILAVPHGEDRVRDILTLLGDLTEARLRDHSLRDLASNNLALLARKIIERAGHTGEHYITATRKEYWRMLASAGGGGLLTAGTSVGKYLLKWQHWPMFVDGFAASMNYSISFVLMQLCGFTLATKQPSMTAAALAGALKEHGDGDMTEMARMIARTTRSQLAALLGNVSLVCFATWAIDMYYVGAHERHFLDPDTARATLHSFHWLASGTMAYAALTGVLLWMSSIAAGWVENWAVYRRLPEAIEEHRVRRFVGVRAMRAVARWFAHHIAGFGGNITLGFLLGMTPILGKFFGLPLDVRHVTLSTSAWLFSVLSLGFDRAPVMVPAAIGVGTMAALNFGVSFFLAISVALRAKHVPFAARWRLLKTVVGHFFRHPGEFFFPPRA